MFHQEEPAKVKDDSGPKEFAQNLSNNGFVDDLRVNSQMLDQSMEDDKLKLAQIKKEAEQQAAEKERVEYMEKQKAEKEEKD